MTRALALAALLFAGSAHAEGQGSAGDPAAAAEAPHFMAATGKPALADNTAENMRLYIMAMLARGGLDFAQRAELTQSLILPDVKAAVPKLLEQWTAIYAAQLSLDDMKAIEAFYQTPAGQRFLAAQNAITMSVNTATINWEAAAVREAIAKNIDALRAHGYQN